MDAKIEKKLEHENSRNDNEDKGLYKPIHIIQIRYILKMLTSKNQNMNLEAERPVMQA